MSMCLCSIAQADSIAIYNADFEANSYADGDAAIGFYPGGIEIDGWSISGGVGFGAGIVNPTAGHFSGPVPSGNNIGFVVSFNSAWLSQTLAATYIEGETYTLTAMVGNGNLNDFCSYTIGLFAGGAEKSSPDALPVPSDGEFILASASVIADESMHGMPIQIGLGGFSLLLEDDPDSTERAVYFDNISLSTTAPTPSTIAYVVPGVLLLVRRNRVKRL